MLDTVCTLILMFFVFSCAGWIMEVVLKYFEFHRFINRGFLIGPYCPIYGFGVVAVTVVVGGMVGRHGTLGEVFFAGMVMCGALEYFTSWYMEKMFHARWWDYSAKPMNLHGRIWIGNLILFGIACVIIVDFIDPLFFGAVSKIPAVAIYVSAGAISAIMLADCTISHFLMNEVRNAIEEQDGDNTEEISKKIHALLKNKNVFMRRIHEAFGNMQARPRAIMQEYKAALAQYRSARRNKKRVMRRISVKNVTLKNINKEKLASDAAAAVSDAKAKLKRLQDRFKISKDV